MLSPWPVAEPKDYRQGLNHSQPKEEGKGVRLGNIVSWVSLWLVRRRHLDMIDDEYRHRTRLLHQFQTQLVL